MNTINPFTGVVSSNEKDPLQEYYQIHDAITRLHLQMAALRNHLLLHVIPKLAIRREEMEIDVIAKELLNWEESKRGER